MLFYTEHVDSSFLVIDLSNGLQFSKRYVFFTLTIKFSVSWLLIYWTVFNHLKMRFFYIKYAIISFLVVNQLNSLQLSKNAFLLYLLCIINFLVGLSNNLQLF